MLVKRCPICKDTRSYAKRTNHVLHAILTFCMLGLWAPVWLIVHLSGPMRCGVCGTPANVDWMVDPSKAWPPMGPQ